MTIVCSVTGRTWPNEWAVSLKDCVKCGGKIDTFHDAWATSQTNQPMHFGGNCPPRTVVPVVREAEAVAKTEVYRQPFADQMADLAERDRIRWAGLAQAELNRQHRAACEAAGVEVHSIHCAQEHVDGETWAWICVESCPTGGLAAG